MKKGSELYVKALDACRAAFYIDFMNVMFKDLQEEVSYQDLK